MLALLFPGIVGAQGTDRFGLEAAAGTGLGTTDLIVVISNIVRIILGTLGILAVLIILYAGFVWMTASGDSDKVEKAKKILVSAVIGLVIIFSAFAIASFIISSLTGNFYGTGGGNDRGPGGLGDLGRWGIGRGPIESVYPAPNATDIPINTRIIVTFKEQIKSDTICNDTSEDGKCDNEAMKNVEICEIDDTGNCVDDGEDYGKTAFAGSVVRETSDKRTFVFVASKYLGALNENTKFKVTLSEGIRTVANPDNSVFSMLSGNQYAWGFTTNGKLDLDPPEVKDLSGVYPYPDGEGDDYAAGAPTPTTFTVSVENELEAESDALVGNFVKGEDTSASLSSTGTYTGSDSGNLEISINSSDGKIMAKWPGDVEFRDSGLFQDQEKSFSANGLTITISAQASRGNSWTANLQAENNGDRLQVKKSGTAIKTLVYGQDIDVSADMETVKENIVDAIIAGLPSDFKAGGDSLTFTTKTVGTASKAYAFVWLKGDGTPSGDVFFSMSSAGSNGDINQTVSGRQDPFRNSIFQINFNEAIDPTAVEDNLTILQGLTTVSNYTMEVANQYRTIELRGNIECGVNSCGDRIYCWPVVSGSAAPTPYSVEIIAAKLAGSGDARCASWGGSDSGDGRCKKTVGGKTVFYPVADGSDGIIDLSGNSLNGSFDTYEENGETVGSAQGQSGSGNGTSGRSAYDLNAGMQCNVDCSNNSARITSYGSSEPESGSGFGDSFKWSFLLSPKIDMQAPLVKTISPVGDQRITDSRQIIEVLFDRLMRGATIRPGYNYGSDAKSKSLRYLVLDIITERINPAGYWVSKEENDSDGNGWADGSVARISHNIFGTNADYSFLAGSGVQSITQNCFLPSGGPADAGDGSCSYLDSENTRGCVRDSSLGNAQAKLPNPASYGKMDCKQIAGANTCKEDEVCQVLYFDNNKAETYLSGSWVLTKDFPGATDGRTGCCFGKCVADNNLKVCEADLQGTETCGNGQACQPADDGQGGYWIRAKGLEFDAAGRTGCCFGKCASQ